MIGVCCRPMRAPPTLAMVSPTANSIGAQVPGGYSGAQMRAVTPLAFKELAGLLAGRRLGLARHGELNRYPGPARPGPARRSD